MAPGVRVGLIVVAAGLFVLAWRLTSASPEERMFRHLVLHELGDVLDARVDEVHGPYIVQAGVAGGEGLCHPATKYIGEGEFLIDGEFKRSTVPYAFVVLHADGAVGGGFGIHRPDPYERHGCDPRAGEGTPS